MKDQWSSDKMRSWTSMEAQLAVRNAMMLPPGTQQRLLPLSASPNRAELLLGILISIRVEEIPAWLLEPCQNLSGMTRIEAIRAGHDDVVAQDLPIR